MAITDDVIMALARYRWFLVAARGATFAYKGCRKDPRTIAGELGVGFLLEGSVRRTGTRTRVSAQLVDPGSGTTVWAEHYDPEAAEVFAVQDAIATGRGRRSSRSCSSEAPFRCLPRPATSPPGISSARAPGTFTR